MRIELDSKKQKSAMPMSEILAVNCGAAHVAGGRLTAGPGGRLALERFAMEPVPVTAGDDGWLAAAGEAVARMAPRGGFRGPCAVGLPGHLTVHRLFPVPRAPERSVRKLLGFEVGKAVPFPAAEVVWSEGDAPSGSGGQRVVTAGRAPILEKLAERLRAAGLFPTKFIPAWAPLGWAWANGARQVPALVLSVGARTALLMSFGTGRPHVRALLLGGSTVTWKLSEDLGIAASEAEALKIRLLGNGIEPPAGCPERMALQIATEQFARRLGGEINRSPGLSAETADGPRPEVLWVTGGGSLGPDFERQLAERIPLPVRRWEPWRECAGNEAAAAGADEITRSRLADLAALAGFAAQERAMCARVNLLPAAVRRERFFRRHGPLALGISAALAAILAFSAARQNKAAHHAEEGLARAERTLDELRRKDAREREAQVKLSEVGRRIEVLERVAGSQRQWAAFLGALEEVLGRTGDAWLEGLEPASAGEPAKEARNPRKSSAGAGNGEAGRSGERPPRVRITGVLFDPENPAGRVGEGVRRRIRQMLADLRASPLVASIDGERFDGSGAGMLRFELIIVPAARALP